jgi:hypothetical protein
MHGWVMKRTQRKLLDLDVIQPSLGRNALEWDESPMNVAKLPCSGRKVHATCGQVGETHVQT